MIIGRANKFFLNFSEKIICYDNNIMLIVNLCSKLNNTKICLLQCTTQYPLDTANANLKVIPELVKKEPSTDFWSVNYIGIIPILIEAVKEIAAAREKDRLLII